MFLDEANLQQSSTVATNEAMAQLNQWEAVIHKKVLNLKTFMKVLTMLEGYKLRESKNPVASSAIDH